MSAWHITKTIAARLTCWWPGKCPRGCREIPTRPRPSQTIIEYSLATLGHEVLKLREVLPRTAPDQDVYAWPENVTASSSRATVMIFWLSPGKCRMRGWSFSFVGMNFPQGRGSIL